MEFMLYSEMSSEWILCKKEKSRKAVATEKRKVTKIIDGIVYNKCERCTSSGGVVVSVVESEQIKSMNKTKKKQIRNDNKKNGLIEECIKKETQEKDVNSSTDVFVDYNDFLRYEKYCNELDWL